VSEPRRRGKGSSGAVRLEEAPVLVTIGVPDQVLQGGGRLGVGQLDPAV
jgi:hypothetical protein